jgi:SH3-like domain-containing protein
LANSHAKEQAVFPIIFGTINNPKRVEMQAIMTKDGILAALLAAMACAGAVAAAERGPVTNLPLPRFVSLKAAEGNVRRGPSLTHRVDWVFRHEDMPLQVTAEYGHWRRVQDAEGQGGWMHYALLSGVRTVLFQPEKSEMRVQPNEAAAVRAYAEHGAIAVVDECDPGWCKVEANGVKGWVNKADLWGVGADEILN